MRLQFEIQVVYVGNPIAAGPNESMHMCTSPALEFVSEPVVLHAELWYKDLMEKPSKAVMKVPGCDVRIVAQIIAVEVVPSLVVSGLPFVEPWKEAVHAIPLRICGAEREKECRRPKGVNERSKLPAFATPEWPASKYSASGTDAAVQ